MKRATSSSFSRPETDLASTSSIAARSSDQRSVNSSFITWSLELK